MQERLLALKKLPLANMAPAVSERLHIEEKAISLFALQQKVRRGLIASHAEHCVPAPHLLPAWEQKGGMLSGDAFEREWVRRKNDMEKAEKDEKHRAFLDEMHLAWRNFGSQVMKPHTNANISLPHKREYSAASQMPTYRFLTNRLRITRDPSGNLWLKSR
jgi:hypothetical protein